MIEHLETERGNPKTENIDTKNVEEILRVMNEEDAVVVLAVREAIPKIAEVIEFCIESYKKGGRIFYAGAGTSGRMGVIDSAEIPPTFGVPQGVFIPLLAGGQDAFSKAVEEVEDMEDLGIRDLSAHDPSSLDTVIGISASGRTPYVRGVLKKAKESGCKTSLICNVEEPEIGNLADVVVSLRTGPEVIRGSTRLKAGTSQKMVLNMISTVTMIKVGKVYKNYMVDVSILNEKLKKRALRMIVEITGVTEEEAEKYLRLADNNVKLAILMILSKKPKDICESVLKREENLRKALEILSH
ncbi:MAG: N-acetylmuramic acid 6-phosphate etherase [Thermotogaceae bacterium]|nr:N-acetylmuramic acid 6-phosphate etherase [Thermotogaceae bacterium]